MNITAEELIDLMFLPMSDEKIIETIDSFGLKQPMIDEQYEIEGEIFISDRNNSGIDFSFEEINGFSKDGEPVLSQIDFVNREKIKLPFGLEYSDDYKTCCKKLGKIADYLDPYINEAKIWIFTTNSGYKYSFVLHFKDNEFFQIRSLVIVDFEEAEIGTYLLENKE